MKTTYHVNFPDGSEMFDKTFDTHEEARLAAERRNSELLFPDDYIIAEEKVKTWKDFMPEFVCLYCVDRDSSLDEYKPLLQRCVSDNNYYAIFEELDTWCPDVIGGELDEIHDKMCAEGMEDEYEENIDLIRDYLWANDKSTPVEDLLRHTGEFAYFYDLGLWIPDSYDAGVSKEKQLSMARQKLNIRKGSQADKQLSDIVDWNNYGGYLRIYFSAPWDTIVNMREPKDDWKQIYFKGKCAVAIYNPDQGSGMCDAVDLDVKFPFKRENLFVSEGCGEPYTIESLCGFVTDWTKYYDSPVFSDKLETTRKIGVSETNEIAEREARYNKVFKEGGCTYGDTNIKRHRDVYYRNEYPCGNYCPHCGQFWVD